MCRESVVLRVVCFSSFFYIPGIQPTAVSPLPLILKSLRTIHCTTDWLFYRDTRKTNKWNENKMILCCSPTLVLFQIFILATNIVASSGDDGDDAETDRPTADHKKTNKASQGRHKPRETFCLKSKKRLGKEYSQKKTFFFSSISSQTIVV